MCGGGRGGHLCVNSVLPKGGRQLILAQVEERKRGWGQRKVPMSRVGDGELKCASERPAGTERGTMTD